MGNRPNLYLLCLVLFPLSFIAFAVGFGSPVWIASSADNRGLWQACFSVFKNCTTFDFDTGGDWMIGVRAVEIFGLTILAIAAADIAYENCCGGSFGRRTLSERLAPGILSIVGGLGGLAGVVVYTVKTNDDIGSGVSYGWALSLAAAGAGLAVIVGVGFCVSGLLLENAKKKDKDSERINGQTPYLTSNDENYELSAYTNKAMHDDYNRPQTDNLPGYAHYNGLMPNRPGHRNSLPPGPAGGGMGSFYSNNVPRGGPPTQPKGSQYYSLSDDRVLDPGFDLSEGYQPARATSRPAPGRTVEDPYYGRRAEDPYSRRPEDPYSRGGRSEDPYSRGGGGGGGGFPEDPYSRGVRGPSPYGPPRAGYNDPYGFDRRVDDLRQSRVGGGVGGGGGGDYDRAYNRGNEPSRDSFYRPGRF